MRHTSFITFFYLFVFLLTIDAKSQDGNKIIMKDGKYGMTTTANKVTKEIIKPKLDDIKHVYKDRIYMFKEKGKWGFFIVYTFKHEVYPVGNPEFDEITFIKEFQHNEKGDYMGATAYFLVKKQGKLALLNFQMDEAPKNFNISPYFDEIGTTADEMRANFKKLFYVKKDSLYGIYSARGVQKCPMTFNKHVQYSDDKNNTFHALAKNNEEYLLVDNLYTNFPLVKADTIWFDQMIYMINEKKDTLSYYDGGVKPIKK